MERVKELHAANFKPGNPCLLQVGIPAFRLVDPSWVFSVDRGAWAGESERAPLLACFPRGNAAQPSHSKCAAPSYSAGIGFELGPKPAVVDFFSSCSDSTSN